jgi:hypothetical protein
MSKDNKLIIDAIGASLQFETIMDSIDFNSYFPEEQEEKDIKQTSRYKNYRKMVEKKALRICENIIRKIPAKIANDAFEPKPEDKNDVVGQYLIYNLFEAKKTRLKGRQQVKRKEEVRDCIDSTHRLHKAFDHIPKENFYCSQKDKNLLKSYNWAKVLFYNELAICYSGLAESSMSLGYSERSISLLKEIYPEKDSLVSKIDQGIHTFALYNKGEAEKLLGNNDLALKTFRTIVDFCEKKRLKSSDYYSALLRMASILTDMGRGKEANELLKKVKIGKRSFQFIEKELERASIYIDMKEYEKAWKVLIQFESPQWKHTFAKRKAKIYLFRLLNEYRKNRPEDFQKTYESTKYDAIKAKNLSGVTYDKKTKKVRINLLAEQKDKKALIAIDIKNKDLIIELWRQLHPVREVSEEIKAIKKRYLEYKKEAEEEMLVETVKRRDVDGFKKTCTKLAEYYRYMEEDLNKALKCFYLYLFGDQEELSPDEFCNIITDWLVTSSLDDLLQKYTKYQLNTNIGRIDDDRYLRDFFKVYINEDTSKLKTNSSFDLQIETITKLKERLIYIYYEEDKDSELEQIEIDFERFMEKFNPVSDIKEEAEVFIENSFFKNKQRGMQVESIASQMKQNTEEFIKNVVGRSKILVESNGEMQGTLSVLRRWNSFTPTLRSSINQSKGGGYFLRFYYNNESFGIVIDPGYDFLENFFSQGFKIGDIDLVLVSHAHPDHTDNLAAILSLFHEMNSKLGKYHHQKEVNKKNPTLLLSLGVFEHYNHIISSNEKELKNIIVFDGKSIGSEHFFEDKIMIKAFRTTHHDLSKFQSLGFIISANKNDRQAVIGYTGDIKWSPNKTNPPNPEYLEHFKECHIICAHLGSIINILNEKDFCNTFCGESPADDSRCPNYNECKKNKFKGVNVIKKKLIEQTREENHLYLAGLTLFFDSLLKKKDTHLKMAIISEFGEELKSGIRMDLYMKFDSWFKEKSKKKSKCLPGDIGLEVDVFTGNVYCHCCKRFVDRARIEPVSYGKEEAICFVCEECKAVLSTYQIDHILKNYCENGRKLESAEPSTSGGSL